VQRLLAHHFLGKGYKSKQPTVYSTHQPGHG
jgi:hypothetical protein